MRINLKVRAKNPTFWIGLIGAIGTPMLAYLGIAASDLTSWSSLGNLIIDFLTNPYLIGLVGLSVASFVGVLNDPTTKGWSDSDRAMHYDIPQ